MRIRNRKVGPAKESERPRRSKVYATQMAEMISLTLLTIITAFATVASGCRHHGDMPPASTVSELKATFPIKKGTSEADLPNPSRIFTEEGYGFMRAVPSGGEPEGVKSYLRSEERRVGKECRSR